MTTQLLQRKIVQGLSISLLYLAVFAPTSHLQSQTMVDGKGLLADFQQPEPCTRMNTADDEHSLSLDWVRGFVIFSRSQSGSSQTLSTDNPLISTPEPLAGTFNQSGDHRVGLSCAADGHCYGVGFVQGVRQAYPTVFSVLRENGSFNLGHPIPELQCDCLTSYPTVSPDGSKLVFVSDRVGGRGKMDLWVIERKSETEWTPPVLLSEKINSELNEIAPKFISADSLLYASDGYGGKGGYDIYLTVLEDGVWQEPEPLTWLNSEFDDTDCILLPSGDLLFSSKRPGGAGGADIWIAKRRYR